MNTKYLIILSLFLLAIACGDGEPDEILVDHYIDDRLQVYFTSFEDEAAARGIDIDLDDLKIDGYIQRIREPGVAGQCQTQIGGNSTVVISSVYWASATEIEKEFLIFHELGHCALGRDHLDSADDTGNCISMMNSGGSVCNKNYRASTRENYLDELFAN